MIETLLQTKLYVPWLRPNMVPRGRLIDRLNQGLGQGSNLTLISAPAGFGKTTLACEWVDSLRQDAADQSQPTNRIAWLSLDESDNDPARFLTYLIAALNHAEGIREGVGRGALGMIQSPQPPPTADVLTSLINEIAALPGRIILVLDDYHVIDSTQVDESLIFLLEHLPRQLHLVIATRDDPRFSLARHRARGLMSELRAKELRFTSSEAAEFLNQVMSLNLSAEVITALDSRTEGWIAGLQLAAISMQGHKDASGFIKSFTGSHRFVMDYLIEEVLDQQSESVQTFLLQTAILNRFSGSLCDYLTGQDNSQATLEMLEHKNLFIVPLDQERRWYRYHHLFTDLLRQRLYHTQSQQVATLHQRASEWYEMNGLIDEAIEHSLLPEDFERAAQLIEKVAETVWGRGDDKKLRHWLDSLPHELVCSKPQLCIFYAWNQFSAGQQTGAEQSLHKAELGLDSTGNQTDETAPKTRTHLTESERMKLLGRIAATRSFWAFYRGDVPKISHYARQALELLPEDDLTWRSAATNALGDTHDMAGEMTAAYRVRSKALETIKETGNIYQILIANMKLAVLLRQQGHLHRTIDICQEQMRIADENGMAQTGVVGWLLAIWGETLTEINDLDGAIQKTKRGVALIERGGDVAMLFWSYLCLMRVFYSSGDLAGVKENIQKMEDVVRSHDIPPWMSSLMNAWRARIWLAEEKFDNVTIWVEENRLLDRVAPVYQHEMESIVVAQFLLSQGRLKESRRLLERLLQGAEAGGRVSRAIEITILQALVAKTGNEIDQAMVIIERALSLAKQGGFVRIFVDEGPSLVPLLKVALSRGIEPSYVTKLLVAFPTSEPRETTSPKGNVANSELVETLSNREIEVLGLIAEGLTNREIASKLFLSLNTVKVHTRNIFGKLDTHNRTHAVAKARALGIISLN